MAKTTIVIVIAAILILAGVGGYLLFRASDQPSASSANSLDQESQRDGYLASTSSPSGIEQQPVAQQPAEATTHIILIKNFTFNPAALNIKRGDIVKWTNQDSMPHNIISDILKSGILNNGQLFEFKFSNSGTFDYICGLHPSMKGRIIVE
ncbi:MAG: cupredoxin family copper-binding protein [Candidatus Portnoybacteria bacterium]|nr:cupredoxin family copper-binding protein [Candidatus Portnoybacteria bacterium]